MANLERRFQIVNKLGLHARAAAKLVQMVSKFSCELTIQREGQEVNGRSIMGVLTLAAAQGTFITVRVEGPDAQAALDAVGMLIEDGFGEDKG